VEGQQFRENVCSPKTKRTPHASTRIICHYSQEQHDEGFVILFFTSSSSAVHAASKPALSSALRYVARTGFQVSVLRLSNHARYLHGTVLSLARALTRARFRSRAPSLCHSIDYDTDASTRHSFSVSSTNIPVPPYLTPRSNSPQVLEASLSFILLIQTPSSKRAAVEEKVVVGLSVAAIAGVRSKVACCEHPPKCRG